MVIEGFRWSGNRLRMGTNGQGVSLEAVGWSGGRLDGVQGVRGSAPRGGRSEGMPLRVIVNRCPCTAQGISILPCSCPSPHTGSPLSLLSHYPLMCLTLLSHSPPSLLSHTLSSHVAASPLPLSFYFTILSLLHWWSG